MPRVLSGEDNVLLINDNISGSEIQFTYRMPTTSERTAYNNKAWKRQGVKLKNDTTKARLEFGQRLLKGIRDGDFAIVVDGKQVPLSSTIGSPGYREDWKTKVVEFAPDLVEVLASRVFDASAEVLTPDDIPEDDAGDAEGNR